jgi:hypothetical protein
VDSARWSSQSIGAPRSTALANLFLSELPTHLKGQVREKHAEGKERGASVCKSRTASCLHASRPHILTAALSYLVWKSLEAVHPLTEMLPFWHLVSYAVDGSFCTLFAAVGGAHIYALSPLTCWHIVDAILVSTAFGMLLASYAEYEWSALAHFAAAVQQWGPRASAAVKQLLASGALTSGNLLGGAEACTALACMLRALRAVLTDADGTSRRRHPCIAIVDVCWRRRAPAQAIASVLGQLGALAGFVLLVNGPLSALELERIPFLRAVLPQEAVSLARLAGESLLLIGVGMWAMSLLTYLTYLPYLPCR